MGRVGIDVAAKFASQVGDGSENATGNDLTFDLSEPDLDLVQPGRIGRGEVKLHARMLCEELSNRLRFMSGEVVENDMNLLPRRAQGYDFIQESKEITTGVPGRGFSVHPAGFGVQRGIERKRAMAVVLEPMTLGASRRQRQNGVEPIQSLDRGLLVDAEDRGVLRRIQVQSENIGRFAFELGIVAGQVTLQAMGFQAGFFPDPMHGVFAHAQRRRQFAATPMRGTIARFLAGGRQNSGPQCRRQHHGLLAGMIGIEPIESGLKEALLPADDGRGTRLQSALDGVEGSSLGQHQDELGAKNVTRRQGTRLSNAAKFYTLVRGEGDFATCRHTNLEA